MDYDICRENLQKLATWYEKHAGERNEATTRLAIIDRLLFECLSWSRDDVISEESHAKKFADYTFFCPRKILIIEAKKEDDYFEIPAGINRIEYSLSSILRDNSSLKAAVGQAADYCQSRGVPYGAVCNGHQLVIFIATRNDGIPPIEGKALVFSSFGIMLSQFMDLWQAISKPGIEEKKLHRRLLGDLTPELPPKLSSTILRYPGVKNRNIFQTDLQIVSDLVIEDITRARDMETRFLKECYCPSGALSQYALMSKSLLEARYAALFDSEGTRPAVMPATTKEGISPELLAQSFSRRPILLIGDVGVGKTIFIRNLIKVEAAPLFDHSITIYLDFGTQATLTTDLRSFVVGEITKQLREEHSVDIEERNFVQGVYHFELERFKKGIYKDLAEINVRAYKEKEINFLEEHMKDKENHLKQSLFHVTKARKKQVVIFLDNADQRDDKVQQEVFLISQELAEHWSVTVFVTIRPETFHLSTKRGALSGYHPKAFTISPPRVDLVVKKRLTFALKLTGGEIPIKSLPESIKVQFHALGTIINIFLKSVEENKELAEFIDNISNGNIRFALDLIKGFFGSGHVDTQKIFKNYEATGSYIVPLHEFLRAVIYGDAEHYDPEKSPIANLFDLSQLDSKEHFILPLIIGTLISLGGTGIEEGFVETSKVYSQLQGLGFTPEQIDMAIIRGHNKKLLETSARRIPQRGQVMPDCLRATTVGIYHVTRLCCQFSYIDAIIVDTPILDNKIRDRIVNSHDISIRINRAKEFCSYLDNRWDDLKAVGSLFDWNSVSTEIKGHIERITRKVELNAVKK